MNTFSHHPFTKPGLIGSAICGGGTLLIHLCTIAFSNGDTAISWMLLGPWLAICTPTIWLQRALGWEWTAGSAYEVSILTVLLMMFLNAIIGALLGTAAAALARVGRIVFLAE